LYIVKYIIHNAEFETLSLFYMTTHKNVSRLSAFLHKKHKMTICSKHWGRGMALLVALAMPMDTTNRLL